MAIYKRGKKGIYYMNFVVNGERINKSTGAYTKREANMAEALEKKKLLEEENLSPHERGARTLLQDAIDQTYEMKWKQNKDAFRTYRRACLLVDLLGNIPLGKIDESMLHKLLKKLRRQGATPATINRYLANLKTILRLKKQDFDFIKLNKEKKGRIRVVSKEEEEQIVHLLKETQHTKRRYFYPDVGDLVQVLIDTGMRLGEALALKYDDIDFDTNLISIWVNKGDRPRSIPMTKRVRRIMQERKGLHRGKPFDLKQHQAQSSWRWVRSEMNLLNDPEFILHALRHSCASRLVNKGIDLYVVKEWLGHSTIQVTERYAHLSPLKLKQAVEVLDQW